MGIRQPSEILKPLVASQVLRSRKRLFHLGEFPSPCYMRHESVLPAEVLALLAPAAGETWVDCTTGAGGHTRLLAERVAPGGRVIALDQDAAMLELARPGLA